MSNEIKKDGEQTSFLDEIFEAGREAAGFVDGLRVTKTVRATRRIEDEPVDMSALLMLRAIVEHHRGRRVTIVIEEDEFRTSIGEGASLRMGVGPTLGASIIALAERVNEGGRVEVSVGAVTRPPIDNKSRAAGEKDED